MATLARKFRFTQRELDRLPPCPREARSKAYECSDSETVGLRIMVTKTGRKFWYWRYTFQGRKRAARVGEYPSTDLAAARRRACEMRALIDQGKDVQFEKDELKSMPTFSEFAEREYMPMARQTKRSHKDDANRLKNHLLPRFGHKRLSEITTREVQACVGEIARTHSNATSNRVLSLISRMLKLATLWEIIGRNPCVGISKLKEVRLHERYLTSTEISQLLRGLEGDSCAYGTAAIKFLLLTGMRRNEALRAKWEQVDLERGLMHLPMTKSGKSKNNALSTEAMALLSALPSKETSQWIFPGRNLAGDKPLFNIDKCFARCLARAGLKKMRVHDLRHAHASILAQNGFSLYVIQQALGQASPVMTMRYSHLCDTSMRDASNAVGNIVSAAGRHLSGDGDSARVADGVMGRLP